jgi:hypothetical protein
MDKADVNLELDNKTSILNYDIKLIDTIGSGFHLPEYDEIITAIDDQSSFDKPFLWVINLEEEKLLTKAFNFTYTTDVPSFFADNYKLLLDSYLKELRDYTEFNIERINSLFNYLSNYFSEFPFEKCSVEITKSKSLKFSLTFPGNKLLIVSKPFDKLEDVSENDIIFSLFVNRVLIVSNVSNIADFTKGFKRFLSM